MNSSVTTKIINNLAIKYGVSRKDIRDIITKYYHGVVKAIESSTPENGFFPRIRVKFLGRFEVKDFVATSLAMQCKTEELMKVKKEEYNIKVQTEKYALVENNEPFFFIVSDENAPKLKVHDRVEFVYNIPKRNIKAVTQIVEAEILDAKHPFYEAAIDLNDGSNDEPKDLYVFRRENIEKIRV